MMSLNACKFPRLSDFVASHFFENAPHGLSIVTPDLSIVSANSLATEIVGNCRNLKFTTDNRVRSVCSAEMNTLISLVEQVCDSNEKSYLTLVAGKNHSEKLMIEVSLFRCDNSPVTSGSREDILVLMRFFNSEYRASLSARYLSYLHCLTPAEQHVLSELLSGKSNHAIASIRGVSNETIKAQVRSITEKIGITSRLGLVLEAMKYNEGLPVQAT